MKVPLVDLRASLEPIRAELLRGIEKILDGMQLFLGEHAQRLEHEFTAYCEAAHGVAVSNGTDAIFVALEALGVGPGDEVIVPSHTFFATVAAVVHAGATPVLVDIEPETMTIDPRRAAAAVGPATRAILPVHLNGHPADMDPLLALAREHRLFVVEDCAQAHGARYKGRRCGSMGDAGAFSFYFTKNLGAFGECGFVTLKDAATAQVVRELRHHGHTSKFEHGRIGYNLRPDEIQALVLRLKLAHLEQNNRRRAAVARRYAERLGPLVRLPGRRGDCEPVHHLFPIRVPRRDELRAFLEERGIGTGIHYKIPAHRQAALRGRPHRLTPMPVTEEACEQLVSLPMYPELTDAQMDYVAGHVRAFLERSPAATVH
jgi:dTDP-4-amino-4,6-dideoxygalactose transaminase